MNSRIKLAINMSDGRQQAWRTMATRSRAALLTEDVNDCAALVTDDPESAQAAVRRGKFVLVADPFGLSADARKEFALSAQAMPAHTARFAPALQPVKQRLNEGQLGEPGFLRIHCWEEAARASADALERELDLALWLFNEQPSEIYAVERPGYIQVHLGFPNGGMALIDLDASVPSGNAYYSLSVIGSTGAAYADEHRNVNLLLSPAGTQAVGCSQGDVALARLIDEFAIGVSDARNLSGLWQETESALQLADRVRRGASDQEVASAGGSHA